jgi:hypothetical protein
MTRAHEDEEDEEEYEHGGYANYANTSPERRGAGRCAPTPGARVPAADLTAALDAAVACRVQSEDFFPHTQPKPPHSHQPATPCRTSFIPNIASPGPAAYSPSLAYTNHQSPRPSFGTSKRDDEVLSGHNERFCRAQ